VKYGSTAMPSMKKNAVGIMANHIRIVQMNACVLGFNFCPLVDVLVFRLYGLLFAIYVF